MNIIALLMLSLIPAAQTVVPKVEAHVNARFEAQEMADFDKLAESMYKRPTMGEVFKYKAPKSKKQGVNTLGNLR